MANDDAFGSNPKEAFFLDVVVGIKAKRPEMDNADVIRETQDLWDLMVAAATEDGCETILSGGARESEVPPDGEDTH